MRFLSGVDCIGRRTEGRAGRRSVSLWWSVKIRSLASLGMTKGGSGRRKGKWAAEEDGGGFDTDAENTCIGGAGEWNKILS